jgi:serine/threonine protein kinase
MMNELKIVERLSNTLEGAIFKAIRCSTGEEFAVKLAANHSPSLKQEIDLMNQCLFASSSPNIIRMIGSGSNQKYQYLILEFASNGDMMDNLYISHTLTEQKARQYFQGVAEAVRSLHTQRICHLDISLENILVTKGGDPKLCDFGAARLLSNSTHSLSTMNGKYRPGKLMYMSPECSLNDHFDPFKADIYSLGVVLFCMLFGFHPYTEPTAMYFRTLLDDSFDILDSTFEEDIPPAIEQVVYSSILEGNFAEAFEVYGIAEEISMEARDLISSMLRLEDDRPSIEDVLSHPWILQ